MKKVLIGMVLGMALVFGVFKLDLFDRADDYSGSSITEIVVKEQVESICNLSTKRYSCTLADKYSNTCNFYGWDVPFTTKSFIASYDVEAYIGVDLNKADVKVSGNSITITLPHAKMMGKPAIDQDSFVLLDEHNSIFNRISVEDLNTFEKAQEGKLVARIEEYGLYDQAEEDVKEIVSTTIQRLPGCEDYRVLVKFK